MKKSIEEKIRAEYQDFYQEVQHLDVDDLNKRILSYAKYLDETEESEKADNELKLAKERAADLVAPYRDAKKAIKLKIRFLVEQIKAKGGE